MIKTKHYVALLIVSLAATSALAQGAADNPKIIDDELWKKEPWEGCYVPDDFIKAKPHAAYVGSNKLEIVWFTKERGSGWVDWTQDNWATTNRAWTARYGIRDFNELIHKIDVTGFDPSKPVAWRAVSMRLIQVATGHIRYEGEPDYDWLKLWEWNQLADRRARYESGAVAYVEEGVVNPLFPPTGKASLVVFNDVHHAVPIYTNLIQYAGKDVGLAVFNGDIIDHSRSEDDIIQFVNAPMAYVGRELHCATRYVRGNHELTHAFPAHLADYMGLQDGQLYGAVDFGPARVVFLDTAGGRRYYWDLDGYVAEEAEWLKRAAASEAWMRAKYRVVIGHIPPCWRDAKGKLHQDDMPSAPLYNILKGKGVTAMICAHDHVPNFMTPNEAIDYPLFVGGAHSVKRSTLIRCEMDDESIHVRILDHGGVAIHDWSDPPRPCIATNSMPLSTSPKHDWWASHLYRVNQVKTAPRTPDFVLLGDSIFHYWDAERNQASWKKFFSGEGDAPYFGINLGIQGDRTESLIWRVQNGLFPTNATPPKAAFVLIGTNNTANRRIEKESPDDTAAGVAAIVEQVKAATQGKTKIIVYGLLPRGKGVSDPIGIRNEYANRIIRRIADNKTVFYRDIGGKFLNNDGTVNLELLDDGLHSGPKGFDVIAEDILAALKAAGVAPRQSAAQIGDKR